MAPPSTLRYRAEGLAAPLPPLLVAATQVAATVVQGVHGRRRVGTGDAFWQFRPYQAGDAPNRIDWRQTARSRDVFVRETEWEAAQSVWLWRDASPSMEFSGDKNRDTKKSRADLLAMALTVLLNSGGERVGLLGDARPPGHGRALLERLALTLSEPAGQPDSLPPLQALPRHARVVMLSDFLSPLEDLRLRIAGLAERGVRGHLLMILDPVEINLPFKGRVRFEGLEGEGSFLARRVESLRPDYEARLAAHQDGLAGLARAAGWSFARHDTGHAASAALMALYLALSTPVQTLSGGGRQAGC